ncbi:IclR family transcriptional regulator [Halalkaliarchaeum desulfuricum]|uniref:IclR family transcriptional regulator n=1 Tax=Halalkaliarchaeum desulfuricum TaxID=2055893 RepID=A0A343TL74_9EURY|nr:IclR family transcriptional regulator [Halalkaliarchaeum desulfuricum]AUX09846.1 IclR family transcriptional regulator [Halalkaliarchaeum desulfuricum]
MHEAANPVKTLKTTEEIINAIENLEGGSVSQIATYTDRPPSIVHNHLDTLRDLEYVVKNEGEYDLGLKFLQRGEESRYRNSLYIAAADEVKRLAESSGELITLLVEEHGKGVYLDIAHGGDDIEYPAKPGERIMLHCSAVGKLILAHMTKSEVNQIIDYYGLPAQTENTITESEELFEELAEIRTTDIAYDRQEFRNGLKSVGAPITETNGEVIGSVSIAGPIHRMNENRINDELKPLLKQSISVIELNLNEPNVHR